MFQNLPDMLR
uniref:Uncharacterized protein n=1 Tax=Anguilla anguilla TaxID=7936 RepID=A0A0E9TGF8_ANGAN